MTTAIFLGFVAIPIAATMIEKRQDYTRFLQFAGIVIAAIGLIVRH